MARTIDDIFTAMVAEGISEATATGNDAALAMFANTSTVSIWRLMFYIHSFCIFVMENIFDLFTASVNDTIANTLPGTLKWYRTLALRFQFGFPLIPDTDTFDNTGFTDDQVAASKIIKYAAVNETTVDSKRVLLIKIATLVNGDLAPLSNAQLAGYTAFAEDTKYAGVPLIIYNRQADLIRVTVDFYYDPLLLDAQGNRLDGLSEPPVPAAALNFLLNLPFNGEFSNAKFTDALQAAFGCADNNVFLISAERKSGDTSYTSIGNTFIPDAGYARFDTNGLTVNYIAYVAG